MIELSPLKQEVKKEKGKRKREKKEKEIEIEKGIEKVNKEKKENKENKENKEKKEKGKRKVRFEEINNTLVRQLGRKCKPYLDLYIGTYYWILHSFIIYTSAIILLFNNNIIHLIALLNIVCMDVIACIFLHDCPLTVLERKYLNCSNVDLRNIYFHKLNVLYSCNNKYEITLEFLTNMVCLIFSKINILILIKMIYPNG